MEKIIWQPTFSSKYDFNIKLDRDFANEMIEAHIPAERQSKLNQLANEKLKRLGVSWLNPYTFYKDTCFVSQFYIGNNGVWLSTNYQTIDQLLKNDEFLKFVEYNSHNVDTIKESYTLITLFGKWIHYADVLKNI